ncbi:glycoside hydrolase [Rickenella mellea]|uniref:AA9 family lytic polysaccharide monooxygenase n=1 Tax=Rickenella mellea TaxID=50990 RepID=A0A4Y7PWE9_9AGAM|nr:glycoside hydrolase [Rickenella mellea]
MFACAIVALLSTAFASGHGGVVSYNIGGKTFQGFQAYVTPIGQSTIQRQWATYNPITNATDANMACNSPGLTVNPMLTATVGAGSKIAAYWNNPWPHTIGPMMVYMANCGGDCTNVNPASLNFFKINESGLLSGTVANGQWGSGLMVQQNSSWTVTIPKSLPNGNYMIRHETLAIHTANQPQFYPECAQLTVIGGANGKPGPTVKFPGGYSATDPSINIDVYSSTATTYIVPGPVVWSG